jgi:restriction endonuclease S subunit
MQISIVNHMATTKQKDFRLDSEFYKPIYLKLDNEIRNHDFAYLINLVEEIRCGPFGSTVLAETYVENGVIVARPFNIKNFTLEKNNLVWISEKDCIAKNLKFYSEGDLFFSRVGDVRCGVVPKFYNKLTISPNIIAVRTNNEKLNPYYATVFFNTKYGFPQIERGLKIVAQPTIQTDLIADLKIVLFGQPFQSLFEKLFFYYFDLIDSSNGLYIQAEHILLSELALTGWKPKQELAFVKNFSYTHQVERIDAEYFQPKYDEIVDAIKIYKGGCYTLGNLVKIKKSIEPGSDAYQESGVPFVRISNLSKYEITNNNQQYISEELYQGLIEYQPKQNEILLSKDATPGIAFHLKEKPDRMIPSGGILRLTVRNRERPSAEYLTLVLNSTLVQQQILRDAGGSIIKHWRLDQVKNTLIPILGKKKQKEIKSKIEDSFDCRKKSKQLLEIAKQGVEMAIEQNEAMAKEWIKMQIQNLDISLNDEE